MKVNETGSVLAAIQHQGGVYMLGRYLPIWAVIITEFCLAYGLELVLGSPMSFKLAAHIVNPKKTPHMVFETLIICATVLIMCPFHIPSGILKGEADRGKTWKTGCIC